MPPTELIEKRTRNSKTHHLGGNRYSWDGIIGSVHYKDNPKDEAEQWKEIDNVFEPAVPPWDWQMLKAGYHIRVKEDFTAGQIIELEKQGETVQFQPMALEWTNDLDMIQPISMPQGASPVITNPEVDLLPDVGMPSHQGTIRWNSGYGEGLNFEWRCTSSRLIKILEVENLNKLPIPEQNILDGGNPVLRLNLIFDPSRDVDIYVDGEVWDKKAKKQTLNVVEFRKDGEVLWGFMPLRYWGSNPESKDNKGQSVATLEKRGNKLYISIRVPYEWLQSAIYPVFIDTAVDVTIASEADDFCDRAGYFYNNFLECGGTSYHAGLRWIGVSISETIDVAYFRWQSGDFGDANQRIYGIDEDNPAAPTNITEFDADPLTSAYVNWDYYLYGENQSPSLVTIFQELVDSYTIEDDAVMLQIRGVGGVYGVYDDYGDGYYCPLHIEYSPPVPTPTPVADGDLIGIGIIRKS